MTPGRPRRLAAATLTLSAALGLAGCGVGMDAQTSQQYQPGIGANVREGEVQLYNALLVLNAIDGRLAFSAGLVNEGDSQQRLVGATFTPLEGGTPVRVEPASTVTVPPGGLFTVGTEGELAGIEGDTFVEGRYVVATLTFSGAGEVTVEVPIVRRTPMYDSVAAEPGASATEGVEDAAEDGGGASSEDDLPEDPQ